MKFKELLSKTADKLKSTAQKVSARVRGNKVSPDSAAPDSLEQDLPEQDSFGQNTLVQDSEMRDSASLDSEMRDSSSLDSENVYAQDSFAQIPEQNEYLEVEVLPITNETNSEPNEIYSATNTAKNSKKAKNNKTNAAEGIEIEARAVPVTEPLYAPIIHTKKAVATKSTLPPKQYKSLGEQIRHKLFMTRLVFSVLSMLFYTVFTIIMLQRNWGNTIYNTVVLVFIGLYIVLFLVMIALSQRLNKSGKKLTRSFKDYKSGLKIMNSVLRLINFALTLSVLFTAAASRKSNTPFQTTVLVISVVWAIFQIFFQVHMIRRRHRMAKQRKIENRGFRR